MTPEHIRALIKLGMPVDPSGHLNPVACYAWRAEREKSRRERCKKQIMRLSVDPLFIAKKADGQAKLRADPKYIGKMSENLRKRRAEPVFAAKVADAASKRMKKRNADPKIATWASERITRLNADQAFASKSAEATRRHHANKDPATRARHVEQAREAMDKMRTDPYIQARRLASIRKFYADPVNSGHAVAKRKLGKVKKKNSEHESGKLGVME